MDPSAAEYGAFNIWSDALDRAGILSSVGVLRAAFSGPILMRVIVLVADGDYTSVVDTGMYTPTGGEERLFNPAEKARCRSRRRACRLRCGLSADEAVASAPAPSGGPIG